MGEGQHEAAQGCVAVNVRLAYARLGEGGFDTRQTVDGARHGGADVGEHNGRGVAIGLRQGRGCQNIAPKVFWLLNHTRSLGAGVSSTSRHITLKTSKS